MKVRLKKIEPGICPYCGSDAVDYGSSYAADEMYCYEAKCKDCERSFEEWYNLSFAGHNVGDNCEFTANPGDEGIEIEMEDTLC